MCSYILAVGCTFNVTSDYTEGRSVVTRMTVVIEKQKGQELTVIIPAFNEAAALERHLADWIRLCEQRGWQVIVVDDGSSDASMTILGKYLSIPTLRILRHRRNRGYGAAIKTGIHHAKTPLVATMDADGQHSPEAIDDLFDALLHRDADLVVGSRSSASTSGLYRSIGKSVIRLLARLLFSAKMNDLNSGLKLYRTDLVRALAPFAPSSMAFSEVIVLLHLNANLAVVEVPISPRKRVGGSSTVNTMTAVDTFIEIVNVVMWFRPLKIFLPVSTLLLVGGVLWALPFLAAGRGLSSAALLMFLTGVLLTVLGLIAEQLAWNRRLELPELGVIELGREPSTHSPKTSAGDRES